MQSSSRLFLISALVGLLLGTAAHAQSDIIGCPQTHDGKALREVGVFEGRPENILEIMPEPGRFVIPQTPRPLWAQYPPYYLGCRYEGTSQIIPVELPRAITVCDFVKRHNVRCH